MSPTEATNLGPLNQITKSFLTYLDSGLPSDSIYSLLLTLLNQNNLTQTQFFTLLSSPRYKRQFKLLLGYCYQYQIGCSTLNLSQAYQSYKLSSDNNYPYAYVFLAFCHLYGLGTIKDERGAFTLIRKAAKAGTIFAMFELSQCYYSGIGTRKNYQESFKWSQKAADSGHTRAMYLTALHYDLGNGTEKDLVKSHRYYLKSAKSGVKRAMFATGLQCLIGDGCVRDVMEAYRWFLKAAQKGHSGAMARVGMCLLEGSGVDKNFQKSFDWFLQGAQCGSREAAYNVGHCFLWGRGTKKDVQEGRKWIRWAAKMGHEFAQLEIEEFSVIDESVKIEKDKGIKVNNATEEETVEKPTGNDKSTIKNFDKPKPIMVILESNKKIRMKENNQVIKRIKTEMKMKEIIDQGIVV